MEPLLDSIPVDLKKWTVKGSIADKWKDRKPIGALLRSGIRARLCRYAEIVW